MFRVRNYPVLQEVPSALSLLFVTGSAVYFWDRLPNPMASHFDWNGEPNGWSSPLTNVLILLATMLMMWGIDALGRYQNLALERTAKRYNWFQILMAPFLLLMPFVWVSLLDFNVGGRPFGFRWQLHFACTFAVWGYLAATENLRGLGEFEPAPAVEGSEIEGDLPEKFCLMTQDAPVWWTALSLVIGLVFGLMGGGLLLGKQFGLGLLTAAIGVMMLCFAGGFRFVVHPRAVEVSLAVGPPLKTIPMNKILRATVHEFSPLQDFGGWGIRMGRNKTTGFIVSGPTGALIETEGRNYLLSTEKAATIVAAIEQVRVQS